MTPDRQYAERLYRDGISMTVTPEDSTKIVTEDYLANLKKKYIDGIEKFDPELAFVMRAAGPEADLQAIFESRYPTTPIPETAQKIYQEIQEVAEKDNLSSTMDSNGINLRKGFRRLTIALSILSALFWIVLAVINDVKDLLPVFIAMVLTIVGIWIIYGLSVFVVNGFLNKKEDCQLWNSFWQ